MGNHFWSTLFLIIAIFTFWCALLFAATDASVVDVTAKANAVVKKFDASTPPAVGKKAAPKTIEEGLKETGSLIEAVKGKAWWFVAASGIFIVMLVLQLTKAFDKMGKRLTWIVAGALSFVAALLMAFDEKGFSWNTFLAFSTAGPTIAWLRGFVKKAILPVKEKKTT